MPIDKPYCGDTMDKQRDKRILELLIRREEIQLKKSAEGIRRDLAGANPHLPSSIFLESELQKISDILGCTCQDK